MRSWGMEAPRRRNPPAAALEQLDAGEQVDVALLDMLHARDGRPSRSARRIRRRRGSPLPLVLVTSLGRLPSREVSPPTSPPS